MEMSSSTWVNIAKSTGDVISQALVQPGILAVQAMSSPCENTQKKIAKNGQIFKMAVKSMVTRAALLPKTWGEPSGSQTRLLAEAEAPWTLDQIKPVLRVFRRGSNTEIQLKHDDSLPHLMETLVGFGLLDAQEIIFVTHGFMTTGHFAWLSEIKDAIFESATGEGRETQDFVIILDWGGGAFIGVHAYDSAAQNIVTVGKWLGGLVSLIKEVKPEMYVWGIGHSLGAHLLGVAGREAVIPECFDRITGLDPAGPGFENCYNLGLDSQHLLHRLNTSDAKFVDVIHTDGYSDSLHTQAIISPTNHYGTCIPLGHVDFYPNWGHSQPGCVYNIIGSHLRSIDLFLASISNPGIFITDEMLEEYPGYMEPAKTKFKVGPTVEMGFHCKSDGFMGNFYVKTTATEPWVPQETQSEENLQS